MKIRKNLQTLKESVENTQFLTLYKCCETQTYKMVNWQNCWRLMESEIEVNVWSECIQKIDLSLVHLFSVNFCKLFEG